MNLRKRNRTLAAFLPNVPNTGFGDVRCRIGAERLFIYFISFFLFSSFWFFFNFFVYLTCLFNCFQYISCFKQKRYSLAAFQWGSVFLEHCFFNAPLIFHLKGIFKPSRCVSIKKGIPVPLSSKQCVRGLYFEKYCLSNVIFSFDGQSKFEMMQFTNTTTCIW